MTSIPSTPVSIGGPSLDSCITSIASVAYLLRGEGWANGVSVKLPESAGGER